VAGSPFSRGTSHAAYGVACYAKGRLEDAENHLLEGRKVSERVGHYSWTGIGYTWLAEIYYERKEYEKSGESFRQAGSFYRRIGIVPSKVRLDELGIVRCGVMLGKRDVDLGFLRSIAERNTVRLFDRWVCRSLGEILLKLGVDHATEAEHWMWKSIEADAGNGVRFQLGLDHVLYAEFFKRQGERSKAQEELGKAIKVLRECGADGWVEKYKRELPELQ
jgi:tetratricopeptide (TPR) repeat protein